MAANYAKCPHLSVVKLLKNISVDFNQVINQETKNDSKKTNPLNQLICCHQHVTKAVNNINIKLKTNKYLVSSKDLNYEAFNLACQHFLLKTFK